MLIKYYLFNLYLSKEPNECTAGGIQRLPADWSAARDARLLPSGTRAQDEQSCSGRSHIKNFPDEYFTWVVTYRVTHKKTNKEGR